MNKNILIVGAGFGQVPAIKKAKELGLTVITIDKNPNAIGMSMADFSYDVDIIDKEKSLEIAKKHCVNGVITMQSDLPVPTIGYINDNLGLKGASFEVANVCSNKMKTRRRLKIKNTLQPIFKIVSDEEEAKMACEEIGFPCVIKAPDSSGSRGITKVIGEDEISNAVRESFKHSRKAQIIVEEYINGLEFGAQTFSVDGTCKLVLLHSDSLSPPPYMIPIGHSFPFLGLSEKETNIAIEDIKQAIDVLGIKNGPANVDFILDEKTRRIKILEVGARIGATCLPELIQYHTGIDWIEQTILNSISEETNLEIMHNIPVSAFIIEAPKDGILENYEFPKSYIQNKNLLEYEITVSKGDSVFKLRKGTDRIGKVIFKGDTVAESEKQCVNFLKAIRFDIR